MGQCGDQLGVVEPVLEVEHAQGADGQDVGQLPRQGQHCWLRSTVKNATTPATATTRPRSLANWPSGVSPLKAMVATMSIR